MRLSILGTHCFEELESNRWLLRPDAASGAPAFELGESPFVVGRAQDCHLVLPESERLRATTSRWHCHFVKSGASWSVADGTVEAHPDTGKPKPSISGTRVNGRRITEPAALRPGDVIEIGPWRFEVEGEAPPGGPAPVDATEILNDVAKGQARKVDAADPKLKAQFGQLHELVQRLAQIPGLEESLTALLSYTTNKVEAAEVAAILLAHPDGGFAVRLAWQKTLGRMPDFRFSSALIGSLPPDQSFLLRSKLKDRSESQSIQDISSGLLLPLWGKGERLGVLYVDNRRTGKSFTDEDLYLGSAIASLVSLQLVIEKQTQLVRIEENMARYFAPDVVQRIVEQSSQGAVGLEVQEKDVTVLFVDMEGFTSLSRTKTPREISELLNPYLETVARCIQAERGHVNKFIGDAVMGIFGAQPGDDGQDDPPLYAQQAVRAALAIPAAWKKEAEKRRLTPLRLRLGINSGRAVVGNIGYSARLEYSVLGDTVNVASRLEKLAPPDRAAVSEATLKLAEPFFHFEPLGEKEVKGVGTLRVFSPTRRKDPSAPIG